MGVEGINKGWSGEGVVEVQIKLERLDFATDNNLNIDTCLNNATITYFGF